MKLIASRLGNDIYHRPGITPVFRIEGVGHHAEFFNTVRAGLHRRQVGEHVIGIAAIHVEIVGAAAASIY